MILLCIFYQALKEELNVTTQQLAHLETRHEDLDYDIDNLINLIGTARATGKWEVADLIGFFSWQIFLLVLSTAMVKELHYFVICWTPG